jgi:hypothetical protein
MAQVCTSYTLPDGTEEEYCYDDGSNETGDGDGTIDVNAGASGGADTNFPSNFTWGTAPGEAGSDTVVDPKTGNITYTFREDDGSTSTMTVGPNGEPIGSTESPTAKGNSVAVNRALAWTNRTFGSTAAKVFSNVMKNPGASVLTAIAAAKAFSGSGKGGGYSKPVPQMDVVREQIDYNDPNRRPGSSGLQYITDARYVKEGDAGSLAAAQAATEAQKQGILAAYKPAALEVNPYAGRMPTRWNKANVSDAVPVNRGIATNPPAPSNGIVELPKVPVYTIEPKPTSPPSNSSEIPTVPGPAENNIGSTMLPSFPRYVQEKAAGGIASLAEGGKPRYLQGETDGMADEIPSNIDGDQEAALSHGEFVIPADVVSHLGNGNSDAGAKKLYQMMDRIREARTGTKEQGKEINPDKFMPGGLAKAYANGGAVQGYNGTTGSAVSAGGVPLDTSKTNTLSPWAGDYVTNMLGQADALSKTPTAVYKGPLTAGASDLQQQGFAGISDIASTGFDPTKFSTGTFDSGAAGKYMNPYLSSVLNPQMDELRRQNAITNMQSNAKLTQAGAYGGGRQAIVNAENDRNLMQEMNKTVGAGYANAFDKAMAQFNSEQGRQFDVDKASEASRQYSADYGLKTANDLLAAGATQRGITGEGIAADKRQFEEQQADPYNRLEFKRKMLEGLPVGASTTSVNQDEISKAMSDISGLASLYEKLSKLIPK